MSDVSAQLKCRGWRLTPAGVEIITTHGETAARDVDALERAALHFDLTEIGAKWLQDAVNRARNDGQLDGTHVLQVAKVKPPSTNPRDAVEPQCKVFLSDGSWTCSATLTEVTNKLVTELVVGAKVQLFGAVRLEPVSAAPTLQLSSANMRVLGGSTKRSGDAAKQSRVANGDNTKAPNPNETEALACTDSNTNAATGNMASSRKPRGPAKRSATQSQSASECENNTPNSGDRSVSKQSDNADRGALKSGEAERPVTDRPGASFRAGRGGYRSGVLRNPPHFPPRTAAAPIPAQAPNGDRSDRPPTGGRERSGDRPAEPEWAEGDRADRDRTERPPPRSTVWDFLPQTIKDDANARRGTQRGGHAHHTQAVNTGSANDSPRSDTPLSGGAQRDAAVDTETQTREAGMNQPPAARGGWRRGGWQPGRPPKRGAAPGATARPPASDRRSFPPPAAGQQTSSTTTAGQGEPAKLPPRLTRQRQADGAAPADGEEQPHSQTPAGGYAHHHAPYYNQRYYYGDDYGYRGAPRGRGAIRGVSRGYNYGRGNRGYGYGHGMYYHGGPHAQNTTTGANARTDADASQSQSEAGASRESPSQTTGTNQVDRTDVPAATEGNGAGGETRKSVNANATDDEKHGAASAGAQAENSDQRRSVDAAPQTQVQPQPTSTSGATPSSQAGLTMVAQSAPNMNLAMVGQQSRMPTPQLAPMFVRQFGFQFPPYGGGGIPYIPPGMVPQRFVGPATFYQQIFAAPGQQAMSMHPMVAMAANVAHVGQQQTQQANVQQSLAAGNSAFPNQNQAGTNSAQRSAAPQAQPAASAAGSQVRGSAPAAGSRAQAQQAGAVGQSGEAQAYQPQAGRGAQTQPQQGTQANVQNLQRQMQSLAVGNGAANATVSPTPPQTQIALDAPSSGSYATLSAQSQPQSANAGPTALYTDAPETQITAVYQNYLAVYRLNQTVRARILSKSETPSTSGSVSTADEPAGANGAARFVKAMIRRIDAANKSLLVVLSEGELAGSEQWTSLTDVRPHYDKPPELSAYRTAEQHKSLAPSQSIDSASPPATGVTSPYGNQNSANAGAQTASSGTTQFSAPPTPTQPQFAGNQPLPIDAMVQQPVTPTFGNNPINLNLNMNLGVTIVGNQPMLGGAGAPSPHALPGVMLANAPYGAAFVRNVPINMNMAQLVAAAQHGNVAPFGAP